MLPAWTVALLLSSYIDFTTQVSTVCIQDGEVFVYNCTVNALTHKWNVPPFQETVTRIRRSVDLQAYGATLRLVEDHGNSITTSLTITSPEQVPSGEVISCCDGALPDGDGEIQETTLIIISTDLLSAPNLNVVALDSQSFNFTIFPQPGSSQCILQYNITPTGSGGHVLPDITLPVVTGSGRPVTTTASGFDLCTNMYNFTAFAVTSVGPGERSAVITYHPNPPSAPNLTVTAVDFQSFNFTILPTSDLNQCVLHYNITPTRGDGVILPDIIAVVNESGGHATANASSYEVCNITYNFTAIAITSSGPGVRSETVNSNLDAVVGFITNSYIVSEADMDATIQIGLLSGFLRREISLKLSVINGTALDERDYQDIEGVVFHLNSSQHILNVSIPLINDADLELNEVLHVSLRLLSDDFSCVTIKPATADIHIFSDEDSRKASVQASTMPVGSISGLVLVSTIGSIIVGILIIIIISSASVIYLRRKGLFFVNKEQQNDHDPLPSTVSPYEMEGVQLQGAEVSVSDIGLYSKLDWKQKYNITSSSSTPPRMPLQIKEGSADAHDDAVQPVVYAEVKKNRGKRHTEADEESPPIPPHQEKRRIEAIEESPPIPPHCRPLSSFYGISGPEIKTGANNDTGVEDTTGLYTVIKKNKTKRAGKKVLPKPRPYQTREHSSLNQSTENKSNQGVTGLLQPVVYAEINKKQSKRFVEAKEEVPPIPPKERRTKAENKQSKKQ